MRPPILVAMSLLVGACGASLLSDREAQQVHVQNQLAPERALASHGLRALPAFDLAAEATDLSTPAPAVSNHPTLGRVFVTLPLTDHRVAVDRAGLVHDVELVPRYVRRVREDVHNCRPGILGVGLHTTPEPTLVTPRRRYVRLADGQEPGPALRIEVDYVDVEPVYATGPVCFQVP
jgi:hypothetical protein